MRHTVWLASLTAICSLFAPSTSVFASTLSDRSEVSLTRTAGSSATLRAEMNKNEYRYVEREETYTVQVPYTVSVPYSDTETYYDSERRCGTYPVSRRVCHNEQRCTTNRDTRTHTERRCTTRRGREVCQDVVVRDHRPVRECHSTPVCRNVIEHEYDCRTVTVPRTRIVTRHRSETHYRSEERVRTVTDKIFDSAWNAHVTVILPEEAELQGDEQETILLRLTGTEQDPDVEVTVDSAIFSYRVADTQKEGNQLTVRLEMVAKYSPDMLGEQTLTGISLQRQADSSYQVQFVDRGVVARSTTDYIVKVADKDTGRWIFEKQLSVTVTDLGTGREVRVPVTAQVNHSADHLIRVMVRREGIVLSQSVVFQKDHHQVGQLNPAAYVDPNGVREFSIEGREHAARLLFVDATPNNGKVDTTYEITLKRRRLKFLWKTTIASATVVRKDLEIDAKGRLSVPMSAFPGVSKRELDQFFDGGDKVFVEIKVTRVSPRLRGHSPVGFAKEAKIRIR